MKELTDTQILDWLEREASLAMTGISLGQEEFSQCFVVWDDDVTPSYLGTGTTLREAITHAIENDVKAGYKP